MSESKPSWLHILVGTSDYQQTIQLKEESVQFYWMFYEVTLDCVEYNIRIKTSVFSVLVKCQRGFAVEVVEVLVDRMLQIYLIILNCCHLYTLSRLTYIISFLRARNDILGVDPRLTQHTQELPTAVLGPLHKLELKH